jgi:endonuclease G
MKICSILCSIVFLICLSVTTVYPDYVKVVRSVTVKEEPVREAVVRERVEPGTMLWLLDEGGKQNGYYHVELVTTGQTGWIYQTFVRRYRGDIPEAELEAEVADPLADPTLTLTSAQRRYAARHLRLGKPQVVYERARQGYVLAQDGRLKIPMWVQYDLKPEDLDGTVTEPNRFTVDTSIPSGYRAQLSDYLNSGFDKGHMAPAADMKRNTQVRTESYLLSNSAPQVGSGFNQKIWRNLETAVRGWVEQRGSLTIITGPIFMVQGGHVSYQVIGTKQVAVPTHFYKIVVDANNMNNIEALAFIMPNRDLGDSDYSEFLSSIDQIEEATGLDFLSALPDGVQRDIESQVPPDVW